MRLHITTEILQRQNETISKWWLAEISQRASIDAGGIQLDWIPKILR